MAGYKIVLVTRMLSQDGVGEIIDYMPVGETYGGRKHQQLVRRVNVVRGIMDFRLECLPAFNYARDAHETKITEIGAVFYNDRLTLELGASVPLKSFKKAAIADFKLSEGQSATFVLHDATCEFKNNYCLSAEGSHELFKKPIEFWRNWLSQCTYKGRWLEIVHRSALSSENDDVWTDRRLCNTTEPIYSMQQIYSCLWSFLSLPLTREC